MELLISRWIDTAMSVDGDMILGQESQTVEATCFI